jgi:hypothetical protein
MNWGAIAAVGEVLGAIAVIGTLLYLASQTRHTRTAVESAANLGIVEAHSRFRQALMVNPDLADLLARANIDPEVTDGERIRLQMLFHDIFMACAVGILTKAGDNTPRTDTRYLAELLNDNPYGIIEWNRKRDEMSEIVPEFCSEIDTLLGSASDT